MGLHEHIAAARGLLNEAAYEVWTVGQWNKLAPGTVVEKDDGTIYVVIAPSKQYEVDVLGGRPDKALEPWRERGPAGKVRVRSTDPKETVRALASIASIAKWDGAWAATIDAPGEFAALVGKVAGTPAGQAMVVAEVERRAKVYGKDLVYGGKATLGPGFARVYLTPKEDR